MHQTLWSWYTLGTCSLLAMLAYCLCLRLGPEAYRAHFPACPSPGGKQTVWACSPSAWLCICLSRTPCFPHRSHAEPGTRFITHLSGCRILCLSFGHATTFSELIFLVPIVRQLPEPCCWMAVSWFWVSLTSCNEMQGLIFVLTFLSNVLVGMPVNSAASNRMSPLRA